MTWYFSVSFCCAKAVKNANSLGCWIAATSWIICCLQTKLLCWKLDDLVKVSWSQIVSTPPHPKPWDLGTYCNSAVVLLVGLKNVDRESTVIAVQSIGKMWWAYWAGLALLLKEVQLLGLLLHRRFFQVLLGLNFSQKRQLCSSVTLVIEKNSFVYFSNLSNYNEFSLMIANTENSEILKNCPNFEGVQIHFKKTKTINPPKPNQILVGWKECFPSICIVFNFRNHVK